MLLATCAGWPYGEPEGHLLTTAFADRGVEARWVVWDDPSVDWGAGLVAVRSTWDYHRRLDDFLGWARQVPRLLNGHAVFAWNAHEGYLVELAEAGELVVVTPVVDADGETSVFVLGGRAVSQVRKVPAGGSVLVHEPNGSTSIAEPLLPESTDLAIRVVETASDLLERHLAYARVDMLRLADGRLAVSELALVEPGLYLDVVADNAGTFADVVAGLL